MTLKDIIKNLEKELAFYRSKTNGDSSERYAPLDRDSLRSLRTPGPAPALVRQVAPVRENSAEKDPAQTPSLSPMKIDSNIATTGNPSSTGSATQAPPGPRKESGDQAKAVTWAQIARTPQVQISDLPQGHQGKVRRAAEKLALLKARPRPAQRRRKSVELRALYFVGSLKYNPVELKSILWESLPEYTVYFVDVLGQGDVEVVVNKDRADVVEGVMRALKYQKAKCESALGELRSDTDSPANEQEKKAREQVRACGASKESTGYYRGSKPRPWWNSTTT